MARLARQPNPTYDYVDVDQIRVDPKYQREETPGWITWLAEHWKDSAVGVLTVSRRADGLYYVIDGQHRLAAARRTGRHLVPCEIWANLSDSEEADKFLDLNTTRNVRAIDRFRAAVEAGHPDQCEIQKIVHDAGWHISDESHDAAIRAVAALEEVYGASKNPDKERHPDTLTLTLHVVTKAWGFDRDATAGFLLQGLGRFLHRYNELVDVDVLIRKLAKYDGGPLALVGRSKELRALVRTTVPNCVAEMLVEVYNVGLRTTRLPAWRS